MSDLLTLSAGSLVVVCGGYGRRFRIETVERVTPTQAIVRGTKFRLSNGHAIGATDKWNTPFLSIDPHLFMKAREQQAENGLRDTFPFSRAGVIKAKEAAAYAEHVLRVTGKWDEPPAEKPAEETPQ